MNAVYAMAWKLHCCISHSRQNAAFSSSSLRGSLMLPQAENRLEMHCAARSARRQRQNQPCMLDAFWVFSNLYICIQLLYILTFFYNMYCIIFFVMRVPLPRFRYLYFPMQGIVTTSNPQQKCMHIRFKSYISIQSCYYLYAIS